MNNLDSALKYTAENRQNFIKDLNELLAIPSISADTNGKPAMENAARWIEKSLQNNNFDIVKIFQTAGNPVVYGEKKTSKKDTQTILFYGHYDVQPVEPLGEWESEPFAGVVRGDYLFARGASDMKGQYIACLKAIESILSTCELPVNVKFILEGEEEIGSPNLEDFLKQHADLLKCDVVVNPDTGMIAPDVPTITYGLRGLAYFELRVYGPSSDLHSGVFGGVVHNPGQALCELIAGMHSSDGKVTLPGFYDDVRPLPASERAELNRLPVSDQDYLDQTGAPALWGEDGYTPTERLGARPTLEVNGLYSGYIEAGAKTVLPSYAMAKISMRLVPDQDPQKVYDSLHLYLEQNAPETIRWELVNMSGAPACVTNRDLPAVKALSRAMETVWGKTPVFRRDGGSVPVVTHMQEILGVDSILTGFGMPDDHIHAPNERLHLPTWEKGIQALICFLFYLAE
jgi:acetylornithine deacetylase/succinyl-diaminopimelate desuccinylase-like protein